MTDDEAVYTRSNGQKLLCKDMPVRHLKSALAKLQRDYPGHPEIGPMAAWVERRDAEYDATLAAQQQEQPQ